MKRFLIAAGVSLVLLLGGAPALALESSGSDSTATVKQDEINNRLEVQKQKAEEAKKRVEENKQKVCKIHEQVVNKIMDRRGEVGQKHLDRMTTLAERVEAFYSKSGKTVNNYSSLVADVNAKKATAQAAVNKVKADNATFKCDGTDGKALGTTFKSDVKAQAEALKNYKTSIISLLKAVKSVNSESSSTGGSQ